MHHAAHASTSTASSSMDAVTQPLGNAAMADLVPDGMDEEMGMLGSVGDSLASASGAADEAQAAADAPLSTGARWLGLDGLVASGDSLSYSGNAGLAKQVDLTLGMLGPLTLGIYGNFASDLAYSLTGTVASGWFGGRYATLAGQARLNLDTAIGAKLALSLGLAEAGLRGALDMKGGLQGTLDGSLELDEAGRPIALPSITVHLEGEVALGAAAELYVETVLTDASTWEVGSLPLGIVTGFGLDLTFGEDGLTDLSGSLGGDFEKSPELEALLGDISAKVGLGE